MRFLRDIGKPIAINQSILQISDTYKRDASFNVTARLDIEDTFSEDSGGIAKTDVRQLLNALLCEHCQLAEKAVINPQLFVVGANFA